MKYGIALVAVLALCLPGFAQEITGINPTVGYRLDEDLTITITGEAFGADEGDVTFDDVNIIVTNIDWADTEISFDIDIDAATALGEIDVTVTPAGGVPTDAVTFTVYNPAPTLDPLAVDRADVGADEITGFVLDGSGFIEDVTEFFFSEEALAVTEWTSALQVQVTIPVELLEDLGQFEIIAVNAAFEDNGGTSDPQTFTVNYPTPTIDVEGISDVTENMANTSFTIEGTGFYGEGITKVEIDGIRVFGITVVDNENIIVDITTFGVIPGDYDVTVTNSLRRPQGWEIVPPGFVVDALTVLDDPWTALAELPDPVVLGGFAAWLDGNLYVAPGGRNEAFYSLDAGAWVAQAEIEAGTRNRLPGAGANAVVVGDVLYLLYGGGVNDFASFDGSAWTALEPLEIWEEVVPEEDEEPEPVFELVAQARPSRGTSMAVVDGGIYVLTGRGALWSYDIGEDEWTEVATGVGRWLNGTFAVGHEGNLLVHQGRLFDRTELNPNDWAHRVYQFSTAGVELDVFAGMPLPGSMGRRMRRRASADGAAGVIADGVLWATKGNNTNQVFAGAIDANITWTEQALLPGTRRVRGGGAVAYDPAEDGTLYVVKGNRTTEVYSAEVDALTPDMVVPTTRPEQSGVMAEIAPVAESFFRVGPNPLAGGVATLRYSLPRAGFATVNVFDAAGRSVLNRSVSASQTGAISLDLRDLSAGIYLVQLQANGFSNTQKLVVQQ